MPKPAAPVMVPADAACSTGGTPPAPEVKPEPDWVRKGLYFGPAFGVADTDSGTDFGWALERALSAVPLRRHAARVLQPRPRRRQQRQLRRPLPRARADAAARRKASRSFGQGGDSFTSGDDGAGVGGGGVLYDLPLDPVKKYLPGGSSLRADYKYFDFEEPAHLATIGSCTASASSRRSSRPELVIRRRRPVRWPRWPRRQFCFRKHAFNTGSRAESGSGSTSIVASSQSRLTQRHV